MHDGARVLYKSIPKNLSHPLNLATPGFTDDQIHTLCFSSGKLTMGQQKKSKNN